MKIKTLLHLIIAALMVAFISCDDDLDKIGSSIQPGGDNILIYVDTVSMTAKTVSLKDSVYAQSQWGLLGSYTDPFFGNIKSDYLTELYCPENTEFPKKVISIDSAFVDIISETFIGDSISPFGIAAYRVTTPLVGNFFTNVNPNKYCDMTKSLGQGLFNIVDAPRGSGLRTFTLRLNKSVGQEFYDEWNSNKDTFKDTESFRKFFKGMYITTNFGSGTLLNINTSVLKIFLTYTGRNVADTADSTRVALFRLTSNSQVALLNHIENKNPDYLFTNSDTRTYLKSPAGVCTELTIPLADIMKKAKETGKEGNRLNAANIKIKGYTEEEENTKLGRSSTLLFINRDSLPNFFSNKARRLTDAKTSFVMELSSTSNSYGFAYGNVQGGGMNNIANLINYYMDYYKGKDNIPDLKYLIIPVSVELEAVTSSSSGSVSYLYKTISNQMSPRGVVLRTDTTNMKMGLIFSNYNSSEEK